jgi:hypothetical protein
MTHASAGLEGCVRQLAQHISLLPHWLLKISLGRSTGFDARARSGRKEVNTELKVEANVGGESSAIARYALERVSQVYRRWSKRLADLTVSSMAWFAARHMFRNKSWLSKISNRIFNSMNTCLVLSFSYPQQVWI